ncbi:DMSO reductase anchor subunit [Sulfurospirillum barnesii SES-3]|uniref:DMSO reductase anchor subunit n=2 Tax=Sulfurospirillum barnesii TaxID=44674 RepID=I3XW75_SULBS|nr:DMSO reductase anchor subunit [Sulfurospirillum barnesii SES-3]
MTLSNLIVSELPLVIFTVMAQASVGFSLIYALHYTQHTALEHAYFSKLFLVFMGLSVVASLFHLGDPFHAPYMMVHLFQSTTIAWLPLEILGVGSVMALAFLYLLKKIPSLLYALPFFGILTLFAMSGIYGSMSNTLPTWDFGLTFFLFASSALVLGGVCYRLFCANDAHKINQAFFISLLGFIFFAMSLVLYTIHIGSVRIEGIENVFEMMHGYYGFFTGGGLLLMGLGLALIFYNDSVKTRFTCKGQIATSFALCMVGLALTRIAFYGLITNHLFLG